jgi:mannose-1-phosphate guanylyltransferase
MQRYAVIIAGGSGERFWPVSRQAKPKQMLQLPGSDRSMLQEAIERLQPEFSLDRILISTSDSLRAAILEHCPMISPANVLAEPVRRNTAGCLVWAAAELARRHPEDEPVSMAVVTADHRIGPTEVFRANIATAMEVAERLEMLVTVGIVPVRPDTAYGYIQADLGAEMVVDGSHRAYRVVRFFEKPRFELAQTYVNTPGFFWNSGMFFFSLRTFEAELQRHSPVHASTFRALYETSDDALRAERFAELPDISIDYALMERATSIGVVSAQFDWDDVGSWDSMARFLPSDARGNAVHGPAVVVQSADCLVYNSSQRLTVALAGVYDLLVVATDDAILVCSKDQAQAVRNVVQELRAVDPEKI